jgi:UDP-N-acetylglucosamine--N-acetylmuramyl-(pentapeptide) pyrophosphoryl-undecaprenol N-acetylglucosamine transferase
MVLFSASGSGIGVELAPRVMAAMREAGLTDAFFVVTGNRDSKLAGEGVFDLGVVDDNQNLVASADLVVSTAGKSTIDEAAAAGTPLIVVPIRHHAEQERNAKALGYDYGTLDQLAGLMKAKVGTREAPKVFPGGDTAARLITSLLWPAFKRAS